ncbi:hypothetical protein DSM101010T_01990 [Desulfovibrio subterraneus]|uniref:Uncharacterized protein n=1 Tax=Desulfovibrio subterraneus TaxID=2718620 RepID=A0A7J0BF41_9BACT|nr:hypothetical protein DSM101010T_01990 [Desulfovibrio subterraneus]
MPGRSPRLAHAYCLFRLTLRNGISDALGVTSLPPAFHPRRRFFIPPPTAYNLRMARRILPA